MKPSAKTAWRLPWARVQKFAQCLANGDSATAAYQKIVPDATRNTAATSGPALAKTPRVQAIVQHIRQALIENATEEFILNRDEIRRYHTVAALTPVGDIDETHFLAQKVTYVTRTAKDGSTEERKIIESVSKSDSLKELAKLGGHYKPEKLEISDTSDAKRQAAEALASDPSFMDMMREEARNMVSERRVQGVVIDLPPLGSMTLEDREEAAQLDEEAEDLY